MSAPLVKISVAFDTISIFFGETLHVQFRRSRLDAFQAWSEGPENFFIEYLFADGALLRTEYDDEEKWKSILSQLEKVF